MVRSQFEHCSVIWRPHNETSLNKIENVQKRAIKWILSDQYVDYNDHDYLQRLYMLELLPMNEKFILTDLSIFHRCLHGNICIKLPNYLSIFSPESSRLRSTHMDHLSLTSSVKPRLVRRLNYTNVNNMEFGNLNDFQNS